MCATCGSQAVTIVIEREAKFHIRNVHRCRLMVAAAVPPHQSWSEWFRIQLRREEGFVDGDITL